MDEWELRIANVLGIAKDPPKKKRRVSKKLPFTDNGARKFLLTNRSSGEVMILVGVRRFYLASRSSIEMSRDDLVESTQIQQLIANAILRAEPKD